MPNPEVETGVSVQGTHLNCQKCTLKGKTDKIKTINGALDVYPI